MTTGWRKFLEKLHPQGIPWPGSALYNAISGARIFQQHYQLVAEDLVQYGPAKKILDIGTGPGHLLFALGKTFPDAQLTGVDISPAMVEQARKNRAKHPDSNIDFQIAGANDLPFEDETFDIVVSTGSIHHWKNPVPALEEIHRITKPNGYALIYDLVSKMPDQVCEDIRTQFGTFRLTLLWLHSFEEPFFDVDEMLALGNQTKFTNKGVKFIGALCGLVLQKTAE